MTAAQQRKVQRAVHLAAALLLVAYLYAPLEAQLQDAVRFIVLPVLVVTGLAMWQAPRIRRLRKTLSRTRALDVAPSASAAKAGRGRVQST
jgi:thiosulfate reductase cytochrome b subunit